MKQWYFSNKIPGVHSLAPPLQFAVGLSLFWSVPITLQHYSAGLSIDARFFRFLQFVTRADWWAAPAPAPAPAPSNPVSVVKPLQLQLRRSSLNRTMAEPRLSSLHRAVQKLGLDEVFPHLAHIPEHDLHAPFAKFLSFGECHEDLDIPGQRFNPTTLPEIAYSEVRNDSTRYWQLRDPRSPLMKPYFTTMSMREIQSLVSQEPSGSVSLLEPPLDTDDFLGCRVFFRIVAEAVEQGIRIVVLREEEQRVGLVVRIKALRRIKVNAETLSREERETVLFQVEYTFMDKGDTHRDNEKILSNLLEQQPKGNTRICLGTKHQIHFVCQVLQAHERLLSESVISQHDQRWKPRQKFVRPSFIVPLRTLSECTCRDELFQEIQATVVSPASDACVVCRKVGVKLKVCSGCKSINYCGRECQVADWRFHKPTCRATKSVPNNPK